MRSALLLLLLAIPAPAGEPGFKVPLPAGDEWEAKPPDHEAVKACFRTEFADSDPKATAEVRVMTYPLSDALAKKGLDAIARDWAPEVERALEGPHRVSEGASKLGSEEAWSRDVRNDWARLTWHVARKGDLLYVFHVLRTNVATDDARLEEQVAGMRTGFLFPKDAGPPDAARPPEPPPAKDAPRETLAFDHWRFECVKPAGLARVEELDAAERASGVVAKFEGKGEQAVIMVRIYAQSRSAQRFTLDQLVQQKLERFEQAYDESHRNPPKRDDRWKLPLAERAIMLELTGRGRTTQVTRWILAECRNDRQYQIEIHTAGGDSGRWSKEIEELLHGFRPKRG